MNPVTSTMPAVTLVHQDPSHLPRSVTLGPMPLNQQLTVTARVRVRKTGFNREPTLPAVVTLGETPDLTQVLPRQQDVPIPLSVSEKSSITRNTKYENTLRESTIKMQKQFRNIMMAYRHDRFELQQELNYLKEEMSLIQKRGERNSHAANKAKFFTSPYIYGAPTNTLSTHPPNYRLKLLDSTSTKHDKPSLRPQKAMYKLPMDSRRKDTKKTPGHNSKSIFLTQPPFGVIGEKENNVSGKPSKFENLRQIDTVCQKDSCDELTDTEMSNDTEAPVLVDDAELNTEPVTNTDQGNSTEKVNEKKPGSKKKEKSKLPPVNDTERIRKKSKRGKAVHFAANVKKGSSAGKKSSVVGLKLPAVETTQENIPHIVTRYMLGPGLKLATVGDDHTKLRHSTHKGHTHIGKNKNESRTPSHEFYMQRHGDTQPMEKDLSDELDDHEQEPSESHLKPTVSKLHRIDDDDGQKLKSMAEVVVAVQTHMADFRSEYFKRHGKAKPGQANLCKFVLAKATPTHQPDPGIKGARWQNPVPSKLAPVAQDVHPVSRQGKVLPGNNTAKRLGRKSSTNQLKSYLQDMSRKRNTAQELELEYARKGLL